MTRHNGLLLDHHSLALCIHGEFKRLRCSRLPPLWLVHTGDNLTINIYTQYLRLIFNIRLMLGATICRPARRHFVVRRHFVASVDEALVCLS